VCKIEFWKEKKMEKIGNGRIVPVGRGIGVGGRGRGGAGDQSGSSRVGGMSKIPLISGELYTRPSPDFDKRGKLICFRQQFFGDLSRRKSLLWSSWDRNQMPVLLFVVLPQSHIV